MSEPDSTPDPFPQAQPHGELQALFPGVWFVTGTMKTVLMGAHWHFSRNMTVLRDDTSGALTLVNTVRLSDEGLRQLDALGPVKHVLRIGALHGLDDAFYRQRYGATSWAMAGMPGASPDRLLEEGGALPLADASLFTFRATKLPEAILHLDREGGILVACDALQNWLAPDAFFSEESKAMMQGMGFFTRANIGPVWMQVNEPKADDFQRLRQLPFKHVLCGHGSPLKDDAAKAFGERFDQVFAAAA